VQIAGYMIERQLGEGATGVVYASRDPEGAAVAVKVLRPELAADGILQARFRREARLAQGISSPHVVPILDVGETDGITYLVLPLYPGGSLRGRIADEERLGVDETIDLAAELGRGLDELHGRGIVHRDVKPSNVLFDADGRAALSDFGLARAVDSTRLTKDGQLLGTPHYLAPELIEGAEATPATDVYAFGCLLYECAAGEPPFAAMRLTELGFAHLAEPAPDLRERRQDIPAEFAEALLAALEKDASARPTTATALARMLSSARTPGRS
jgi:eukaryotic-like serine/threonine-protein kinase